MPTELVVAASVSDGSGSTAGFLARDMQPSGSLHGRARMAVLVVSHPDSPAKARFEKEHPEVAIREIIRRGFATDADYAAALTKCLEEFDVNVYGQYGLIVKTPVELLPREIAKINQHPVPKWFGGWKFKDLVTHTAVLEYMRLAHETFMYSECIAQYVHPQYDKGLVIQAVRVPVFQGTDPKQLQEDTIPLEWQCQSLALHRLFAEPWPLSEFPTIATPMNSELIRLAKTAALTINGYDPKVYLQ